MLSIRKGVSETYYLDELGWRLDRTTGYFVREARGGPEPDGVWFDPGRQLGVLDGGSVDPLVFVRLHAGFDAAGLPLVRHAGAFGRKDGRRKDSKRVAGYDLTFSAPKSVSLLWGLGDDALRREIETAHRHAVRAALGHVERHVISSRMGKDGTIRIPARLTSALWQHGASRPTKDIDDDGQDVSVPGDMQLHTHAFVFNMTRGSDGKIRTLDASALYTSKLAVGAIYRAELANTLRERLKVGILITDDTFEVDGVPFRLMEEFSKRARTIRDELGDRERSADARDKEAAALRSRCGKDYDETAEARHRRWRAEVQALGYPPEALASVFRDEAPPTDQSALDSLVELSSTLTAHTSVVPESRIWQKVAVALQGLGGYDAVATEVERQLRCHFLCVGEDERGQPLYTTPALIEAEQAIEAGARHLATSAQHALERPVVDAVLAMQTAPLSDEQREAVIWATTGPDLAVVEGGAGTGKSHAMRTVAQLYRSAGYRVVGAAAAWRVARQLGEDCGIEARATRKWLFDLRRCIDRWDGKTVLILDEAGMTDAVEMRTILDRAIAAEAKIILTGDRKQLSPVGPGPGLGLAVDAVGRSIRLRQTRRQVNGKDRDIATWAGDGEAAKALEALDAAGRLHLADGWQATLDQAVADWARFSSDHPDRSTLIMAQTNAEVRRINAGVREVLKSRGVIADEPEVTIKAGARSGGAHNLALAPGDLVRFYRREKSLEVINGTVGTVIAVASPDRGHADLEVDVGDRRIRFNTRQLYDDEAGHTLLGHAYASTVHGAQGLTVDDAWAVMANGSRTGTANATYVMLSRNRHQVRLVVNRAAVEDDVLERSGERRRPAREAVLTRMAADLSRPAVQHSALVQFRRATDLVAEAASGITALRQATADLRKKLVDARERVADAVRRAGNAARKALWRERLSAMAGIVTLQQDPPGPEPGLMTQLHKTIVTGLRGNSVPEVRVVTGTRLSAPIPHRVLDIVGAHGRLRLRDTGAEIRLATTSTGGTDDAVPGSLLRSVYRAIGIETRRRGWTSVTVQAPPHLEAILRESGAPATAVPTPPRKEKPERRPELTPPTDVPPARTRGDAQPARRGRRKHKEPDER